MRFSGAVKKRLQKDISVDDLTLYPSIQEQARVLDSRPVRNTETVQRRLGPPSVEDMTHCSGQTNKALQTEGRAKVLLKKLGLSWNDVEDIIHAPDVSYIYLRRRRPQTWTQRAIYIAQRANHDQLVNAWKAVLLHHPMLRAIPSGFPDEEYASLEVDPYRASVKRLFIVLQGNDLWWNCSISTGIEVQEPQELRSTFLNEWADADMGPLVRVAFANIRSTGTGAFILVGNHAAFDNLSMNLVLEDLNSALDHDLTAEEMLQAPGHTSYKDFADRYYLHRRGNSAMEAVAFHAQRLRGIGNLKKSLWPAQRAPGWFKGCDDGWTNADGTLGDTALRIPLDQPSDREGVDGLTRTAPTIRLKEMKAAYGILPHIILKAAVSLFNMRRTGTNAALFANVEAGRSWPFSKDWTTLGEVLQNPLNIAGPLFHVVINRIEITNPDEKVIHLLKRVQEEQVLLSQYCQAPLFEIQRALSSEDVKVMDEAVLRQGYNWAPGIQSAAAGRSQSTIRPPALAKFQRVAYDDIGFAWTCGLWDPQTLYVNASYDDCQLSKPEVMLALEEVLCAGAWLSDPNNVEKKVSDCVFEGMQVGELVKSLE
ncbi:hypothetical protein AOQ84DRAFT_379189 [Glonium stellatum]|uniref:Acyltransferase n=1 Tax=Glonium stellatum TaxID=574774 RepID=A0A8E2EVW3_9PEZI|nr:hypothetical protein AOQ84DRAFT_379189 [Glonium stellatum]